MKKLYQMRKWKLHSQKHSLYKAKKRKQWKAYRKAKNQRQNSQESKKQKRIDSTAKFETVKAPTTFSLIENPEEFITFIDTVRNAFLNNQNNGILIESTDIERITPDAVMVLISKLMDPKFTNEKACYGTFPKNEAALTILLNSSFHRYVTFSQSLQVKEDGLIIEKTENIVDSEMLKEIRKFTSRKVYGDEDRRHLAELKTIYRVYQELMGNTVEHGKGKDSSETNRESWWTSVYCGRDSNRAEFSFVDNGVGIFESGIELSLKNKIEVFISNLTQRSLFDRTNADILMDILTGKLKNVSRTNQANRGLGLWRVFREFEKKGISNLIVITNDAFANLSTKECRKLHNKFNGTFFYWEYQS